MSAYTFTPQEALVILKSKGLTPFSLSSLLRNQPLKKIALDHKIGHVRLSACAHALDLYTVSKSQKISSTATVTGKDARESRTRELEITPELLTALKTHSIEALAKKRSLDETLLRQISKNHGIEPLTAASAKEKANQGRRQKTDERLLSENIDTLHRLLEEDASLNSIAKQLATSKNVLNRLIPRIDPGYFSPGRQEARQLRYAQEGHRLSQEAVKSNFIQSLQDKYQTYFSNQEEIEDYLYGQLRTCLDLSTLLGINPSTPGLSTALEDIYDITCDHSLHRLTFQARIILEKGESRKDKAPEWWKAFVAQFKVEIPPSFSRHPDIWVLLNCRSSREGCQWLIDKYKLNNTKQLSQHLGVSQITLTEILTKEGRPTLKFHPSAAELRVAELTDLFSSAEGRALEEKAASKAKTLTEFWGLLEVSQTEGYWLIQQGLIPRRKFVFSTLEFKVNAALANFGVPYQTHVNGLLPNKRAELDFYILSKAFAIEVNPTHTHNSTYGWGYNPNLSLDATYHQKKVQSSREAGIELVMLYEKDLLEPNWSAVTLPFLKFKLLGADRVFYGRQVAIREFKSSKEKKQARIFLSAHHAQGSARAQHYYGFSEKETGELLGVASFTENNYIARGQKQMELKRLAFLPGVQVRFGISKLVSRFFEDFGDKYDTLFSYSRNDMGSGQAYKKAGFSLVRDTAPSLTYVNPTDPYDTYSWSINSTWGAANGVLASFFTPEQLENADRRNLITTKLPRRTGNGLGYVEVYNAGNRLWKIAKQPQ